MNDPGARLAKAASLMGDPSRASMLWSLLGGESRPASELAMLANVSPQTASNHLKLLLNAGFVTVASSGRNKFYRLGGRTVANAIESLASVLPRREIGEGAAQRTAPELVFARTCYDHLAGELGVAILNRLLQEGHLREHGREYLLSPSGDYFFRTLRIDFPVARSKRRRFAYPCLDWSHRTPHLGGALGASLLEYLIQTKIVARPKAGRIIRVTSHGQRRLQEIFAIRLAHTGTAVLKANPRSGRRA